MVVLPSSFSACSKTCIRAQARFPWREQGSWWSHGGPHDPAGAQAGPKERAGGKRKTGPAEQLASAATCAVVGGRAAYLQLPSLGQDHLRQSRPNTSKVCTVGNQNNTNIKNRLEFFLQIKPTAAKNTLVQVCTVSKKIRIGHIWRPVTIDGSLAPYHAGL